jgi:hypothetical protein
VEVSAAVAALVGAGDMVEEEVVVPQEAASNKEATLPAQKPLTHLIPSQTMQPLVANPAGLSMFAISHGPQVTRISSSSSPPSVKLNVLRSSTSLTAALEGLAWSNLGSRLMQRPLSVSFRQRVKTSKPSSNDY